MPHLFFEEACSRERIKLPDAGQYGVGMIYLPHDAKERDACEKTFEKIIKEEGQQCLGWRTVPTDNATLGPTAKSSEPFVRQIFIGRASALKDDLAFERKLYVIRRRSENAIRYSGDKAGAIFMFQAFPAKR